MHLFHVWQTGGTLSCVRMAAIRDRLHQTSSYCCHTEWGQKVSDAPVVKSLVVIIYLMVFTAQINPYNFLLYEYVKQNAKTRRNICDKRHKANI